jgi:hypothetical protein
MVQGVVVADLEREPIQFILVQHIRLQLVVVEV